jgi:polyisoprenoid-binding protein YceI
VAIQECKKKHHGLPRRKAPRNDGVEKEKIMKKILLIIALVALNFTGMAEAKDLTVKSGTMNFTMIAPVETIKGKTSAFSGNLTVGDDLKTVKGEVNIDISKITTYTFKEADKNKTQNEHMLNWFEIGDDVKEDMRNKYKTAKLVINGAKSVKKKSATSNELLLDADLTVHGITKKVSLSMLVEKNGEGFKVKTLKPFDVGLVEYDIRPRDLAGKILQKTLEALGHKVAKYAKVDVILEVE